MDGARRIAVLRCNALGDYLMAAPALEALAVAYPQAELTLLGASWQAEFLTGRPGPVDRVVVLPEVPGLAGQPAGAPPASGLDGFLAAARAERFDLAVQLHGGGARSNALVAALGARVTAGLRANDAPPLDRAVPYRYYQSEVARYLEVVGLVGASAPPDPPELAVTPEEDRAAAELLTDAADDGGPWVGLHPGATDPRRRWPVSRFADVARALVADGAHLTVVGAAGETAIAGELTDAAGVGVLDLSGRTGLGVLAAVLRRCAVVAGNDSGPVHLAQAVGTATVGLYWCGNAITAAPATRTRHRPLLSWTVHCPQCGVDCTPAGYPHRPGDGCEHRPSFLTQIPVAEVLEEIRDLLAGQI